MIFKNALFLVLILTFTRSFAQLDFVRNDQIQVYQYENLLINPWAGGINSAQVSRIDLNGDDILDLFIFDKVGNRVMTFLNLDNTSETINYKHKYGYVDNFPEMRGWVLLRDFNCDGLVDIFTNNFNGITVYENVSVDGNLAFELRAETINSSYNYSGTPFTAPMYCLSVDIPSIVDLDDDGDLDILTWADNNVSIFYYENLGSDIGICDSLAFQLGNRCYGMLNESSESPDIFIGDTYNCDFNVIDPTKSFKNQSKHNVHAGGTLLNIDLDQNGLKDVILSDVTEINMQAILMEPSINNLDSAVLVTPDFPEQYQNTPGINFELFPAAYYEDIDNDGVSDLLSSPNLTSNTRDYNSLWYYKNNGENDLPDFELIQEDFMQNTMIDLGRGALPVAIDYNNDGLMDLMVANQKAHVTSEERPSRLALFENTGSAEIPEFTLIDPDYLEISSLGLERVYPTFGDTDGDSDLDLIVGNKDGTLYFFENIATLGQPANWEFNSSPIEDFENNTIDIGKDATPQLFDIDNDGKLDLIVGEENGNINYIHNIGTTSDYSFEVLEDTIGNVVAANFLGIKGNSVPFMWRNADDEIQLVVGTETGILTHYTDIEGNIENDFTLVSNAIENINEGSYSAPCLYDFTNDGKIDLIFGNVGGGLAFYQGGNEITVDINSIEYIQNSINVYPNPSTKTITLSFESSMNNDNELKIYNSIGALISTEKNIKTGTQLNLSNFDSGIYFLVLLKDDSHFTGKFVKK